MVVDPWHRYSNESERANEGIYNGFELKKTHLASKVFIKKFSALRVKVKVAILAPRSLNMSTIIVFLWLYSHFWNQFFKAKTYLNPHRAELFKG